jgi:hypothetical protein
VASDIFGVSGRAMMAALIAGQRDPQSLAQLAEHHAFLLARMLARIDAIDADITTIEERIEELTAPFAAAVTRTIRTTCAAVREGFSRLSAAH